VPSASSTRAAACPMPSVDPVMPMTAMVVILPRPADRHEPGLPTLDLVCRERTFYRALDSGGRMRKTNGLRPTRLVDDSHSNSAFGRYYRKVGGHC
jgi:hypothetical protein